MHGVWSKRPTTKQKRKSHVSKTDAGTNVCGKSDAQTDAGLMPGSKNLMRRTLHCVIDEKNLMPVRMSAANLMRNLMHGLMHKGRN